MRELLCLNIFTCGADTIRNNRRLGKCLQTGDPVLTLDDDGGTVGFLLMPDSAMTTTCVDGTLAGEC